MSYMDAAALGFFVLAWGTMNWLIDASPWHKFTLGYAMNEHRRAWMQAMALRMSRIADTNVSNGLQTANSFFASTALLAVGAGFGLLTAADTIINAFEESFVRLHIDRSAFYVKTALLMALYAYAFFKFGWAYRLYNYCGVMMMATPDTDNGRRKQLAAQAAEMNVQAAGQFTYGLRAFFLAIALLAWFINHWMFAFATLVIVGALLNRQFNSKARDVAIMSADLHGPVEHGEDRPGHMIGSNTLRKPIGDRVAQEPASPPRSG